MTDRRASRRDLFRLLGRSLAEAAGEKLPAPPPSRPRAAPPAPALDLPLEHGRLVLDLAAHPVPPGTARRVHAAGWPEPVLLVRVSAGHFAAVGADCPGCEGALRWDAGRDAALCPRGEAAFRMDGLPADGSRDLRLRVYLCRVAGPRVEIDLLGPPEESR